MKQVLIQGGEALVSDVPTPQVGPKNVLVQVAHSCISTGTEMAGIRMSGMPLYRRALKQPENVRRAMTMVREEGIRRTLERVSGKLASGVATGYSAAGVVIEVGEEVEGFSVGDRVACAGAGIANHAEFIDVPVNLAVKLPDGVSTEIGATVTLGAIALQGVRRASPTLGETILVVGLGILGQLTVQMLAAAGCRVLGTDLDEQRIAVALRAGMDFGIDASKESYVEQVLMRTENFGADAVIITAATESHQVISEAMQACRKKGRVVLVGDVGLNLKRADFYKKELDFLVSTSYGPGRYDPVYEEGGQDYPLPYVRWTENRNMEAYIELLATRKLRLDDLLQTQYPIERAGDAYGALKEADRPLLVLLSYPPRPEARRQWRVDVGRVAPKAGKIQVALVGASSFAQGVHLPNMGILRDSFELRAVMSRTGANARAVAVAGRASYCTTDYEEILKDDLVDLVMITTRHNLHGPLTLQALRAGKNVFVEKPLTLDEDELAEIEDFYRHQSNPPLLMVGFNRRFSPAIGRIREVLKGRSGPLIANYRMNAGYIPLDHWVHGPEGGGRNLGEACHIYDLFNALCDGSREVSVTAVSARSKSKHWAKNDNFVATIGYADGSVCTLTYTALGTKSYPKERMDLFSEGKVITLDDYKAVQIHGGQHKGWASTAAQKGQLQELEAVARTLLHGDPWPIPLAELVQATRIGFAVERQISGAETRRTTIRAQECAE